MKSQHLLGSATLLGVLVVLLMIAAAISRHPASVQGGGRRLLWFDIVVLLAYMAAGIWLWQQSRPGVTLSASIGAQFGIVLGGVHIANHLIEFLMVHRPFVLIIAPIFLMLLVFGAAGSAVQQRTGSLVLAVMSGGWCAVVGILIALSAAFLLNLAFEGSAEIQLRGAFASSGMHDPGDFLIRNMLQATSEGLIRMPILGVMVSFGGAVTNVVASKVPRRVVLAVTLITPLMLVAGAATLWYADSLERASRPPFIMAGVILAGAALSSAHAIWSALHHRRRQPAT